MKSERLDIDSYDNFVFDLYGTLIDIHTDEWKESAWVKWSEWLDAGKIKHPEPLRMREEFFSSDKKARDAAKENGKFTDPEIDVIPIYKEMLLRYGNEEKILTKELLSEIGYAFRTATREYACLFEGLKDFFSVLRSKEKHIYILSNAQRCYTWPEICLFGLDKLVDDVLISSDLKCMKPDVCFYNAMAEKHNFDKSRTIMFGDSKINDYEGALNAGWNGVHLSGLNNPKWYYKEQVENQSYLHV